MASTSLGLTSSFSDKCATYIFKTTFFKGKTHTHTYYTQFYRHHDRQLVRLLLDNEISKTRVRFIVGRKAAQARAPGVQTSMNITNQMGKSASVLVTGRSLRIVYFLPVILCAAPANIQKDTSPDFRCGGKLHRQRSQARKDLPSTVGRGVYALVAGRPLWLVYLLPIILCAAPADIQQDLFPAKKSFGLKFDQIFNRALE